jgi:hypothetical protein
VIEGDSITSTTPNQVGGSASLYSYLWKTANPAMTVSVNAQSSRTVGGPAYVGPPPEGADVGSPAGNTLLDNRTADFAFAPQLLTVMIGANDLGTFSAANTIEKLIAWAAPIRAAGIRIAVGSPTPYRDTAPRHVNYASYTTHRAAYLALLRDPSVWSLFADAYVPLGEHPDFNDPALIPALYADEVHPSGHDVAPAGSGGHVRLLTIFEAAMATLIDASRAGSAVMSPAAWPVGETNLMIATEIVRRFIVTGIAHAGLASGSSVSGGDAQLRLNGGAYGSSVGRIYNGDVIDLKLTTSASHDMPVSIDLTVGGETRTIVYRTVADVTPATIEAHGFAQRVAPEGTSWSNMVSFGTGTALLVLSGVRPASVAVGGNSATLLNEQAAGAGDSNCIGIYAAAVAAGSHSIDVTWASESHGQRVSLFAATLKNADAAPIILPKRYVANESSPHILPAAIVPAGGVYIAAYLQLQGASGTDIAVSSPGMAEYGTDVVTYQSDTRSLCIAVSTATGLVTASFDGAFGSHVRVGAVFKGAGT